MKNIDSHVRDIEKEIANGYRWSAHVTREAIRGAFDMTVKPLTNFVESRINTLSFGALGRWKAKRALAAKKGKEEK